VVSVASHQASSGGGLGGGDLTLPELGQDPGDLTLLFEASFEVFSSEPVASLNRSSNSSCGGSARPSSSSGR
jgi:hypothetical protein